MSKPVNRIAYLDGLRGLAILLVFLFHGYYRWHDLMPFGSDYADFPLFKFGYLGVHLFFLISGFVILMTLERCHGPMNFIFRRWARLFPAMLVCSVFVIVTAPVFTERPRGEPELLNVIPGLLFVEPYILEKLTGYNFRSLEGVFWSLYVEVKFYVFSAVAYFLVGSKRYVVSLLICMVSWLLLEHLSQSSSNALIGLTHALASSASFEFFGWFSSGAAFYLFVRTQERHWLYYGVFAALLSSAVESNRNLESFLAAMLIVAVFTTSVLSVNFQKLLSNRLLLFFGFISYPLYLIHENMAVSMIIQVDRYFPNFPGFLLPLVALAVASLLAFIIARVFERQLRGVIYWVSHEAGRKGRGDAIRNRHNREL